MKTIYSIGHSRHHPDDFAKLLKMHQIDALYDVRSRPYSRFNRQFNRETLEDVLKDIGITYVFMGGQLGGKPEDPCCYDANGILSRALQIQTPAFQKGIARLRHDAAQLRVAIMCAEKDPLDCHRTWLIAENVPDMTVIHIHADGRTERHADMMAQMGPKQGVLGF